MLLISFSACLPDDATFENFRRDEVRYMLSNSSEKVWLINERIVDNEQIELEDCDSARQLVFKFTSSATDKDSLFYINRSGQCADSTTIQKGFWFIPANTTPASMTDSLVFVWNNADTNYYRITEISPASFQIESFLRSAPFQETYVLPDSVDL